MSTDDDTYPGQTTPREYNFNGGAYTFDGRGCLPTAIHVGQATADARHSLEGNTFVVQPRRVANSAGTSFPAPRCISPTDMPCTPHM